MISLDGVLVQLLPPSASLVFWSDHISSSPTFNKLFSSPLLLPSFLLMAACCFLSFLSVFHLIFSAFFPFSFSCLHVLHRVLRSLSLSLSRPWCFHELLALSPFTFLCCVVCFHITMETPAVSFLPLSSCSPRLSFPSLVLLTLLFHLPPLSLSLYVERPRLRPLTNTNLTVLLCAECVCGDCQTLSYDSVQEKKRRLPQKSHGWPTCPSS